MPTYDYQCTACDTVHEVFHGFRDPGPESCPHCGAAGALRKLISAGSGVIFRGTGFYETDYKRNRSKKEGSSGSDSKPGGADSEKAATETSQSGDKSSSSGDKGGESKSTDAS